MGNKLTLKLSVLLAAVVLLAGCGSDEKGPAVKDGVPGQVTDLKTTGDYGRISLSWKIPADEFFYYVKIDYTDPATGSATEKQVTLYSADQDGYCYLDIDGYTDQDEHEFTLTSYSFGNTPSQPLTIKGSPKESPIYSVRKTITVEPDIVGAIVSWENEFDIPVIIAATYYNYYGEQKTVKKTSSTDGTMRLGTISETNTEIRVQVWDNSESSASEILVVSDLVPLTEVARGLDTEKLSWTVVDYNGGSMSGDNVDGPIKLIDGTLENIWHSQVGNIQWPAWVIYDMQKDVVVTSVGFYRRTDLNGLGQLDAGTMKTIRMELSTDNQSWTPAGEIVFNNEDILRQTLYLEQTDYGVRYMKLTVVDGYDPFGNYFHMAEMEVDGDVR